MAHAQPNPKRVEFDRSRRAEADAARIRQRELDDLAEIERQKRIKREIHACYFVGEQILGGKRVEGYSPKQIKFAGKMIEYGRKHDERELQIALAKKDNQPCWERIGRSRGGKRKGSLYRCTVALA